jgi:hypothetical protein
VLSSVSFWIGGGASLASCATEVILTGKDKQQRKTSTSFIILIHLDETDSAWVDIAFSFLLRQSVSPH